MALDEIVAYKKKLLEQKKDTIASFRAELKPTKKSLLKALTKEKSAFIFEIKPASPSLGVIRKHVDISNVANIYAPFADAISVLADEQFFGGSLKNVEQVSNSQTCPVLCKDVVVSPLQIYEARYYGADAVLLMLSVLDDETFQMCAKAAVSLNMDFITEVHTEEEIIRAKKLNAKIIGINNRNLQTLEVDLKTTEKLKAIAPKDAILISESGFSSRSQIKKLSDKVNGFLIGTALMRAERIDLALRELLFGRVKICGLTNREDAYAAYVNGAYYGGLNFASVSKRKVSLDDAFNIKKNVPLKWGGIFVNQAIHEVKDIADVLDLDFVQLHGDETKEYVAQLRAKLAKPTEIWQAIRIKPGMSLPTNDWADRVVLDTHNEAAYGGCGQAFDWSILQGRPERHRLMIAGGVNASNIEALSNLDVFGIDIASGVEDTDPRKKSLAKIIDIFKKLRP